MRRSSRAGFTGMSASRNLRTTGGTGLSSGRKSPAIRRCKDMCSSKRARLHGTSATRCGCSRSRKPHKRDRGVCLLCPRRSGTAAGTRTCNAEWQSRTSGVRALAEARSLLDQDKAKADSPTTEVAAHYDGALFGLQVAICYCEAGQPERSLELYGRWLSPETFSRRDYAYFLALKGEAHAAAEEPDNAAVAGLEAFSLARETESVRTVQEVTRLAVQLEQWRDRESVHELRKSVLVG